MIQVDVRTEPERAVRDTTSKGNFHRMVFKNDLAHDPGVLSMARAMHPDSAGSQFFIMHEKSPHLDGAYAAFRKDHRGAWISSTRSQRRRPITATDRWRRRL